MKKTKQKQKKNPKSRKGGIFVLVKFANFAHNSARNLDLVLRSFYAG